MEQIKKIMRRGSGDNDTFMDLQNFGDDENQSSTLLGGQLEDLYFELSKALEALDIWGRHLSSQCVQYGLYEDDDKELNLMILDDISCDVDTLCVYVRNNEPFWEVSSSFPFKQNTS